MKTDKDRQDEAAAILRGVERDQGSIFDSAMARAADHLKATDAPDDDRIELWGRRIGRGLSMAALLGLGLWYFADYFAKK